MATIINDNNIRELINSYFDDRQRLPEDLRERPLNDWDVSRVTNMERLFSQRNGFNEDISAWDVSNVSSLVGFMDNINYSTTNYDLLLNGWCSLPILQYTVTADFDGIKYTSTGEDGRDVLINTYGWTVNDGGKI